MKQKHSVIILLVLIMASGLTSLRSYQAMERLVTSDMSSALAQTLEEQQSDVISCDTIRVFNSHLKLEQLRGRATLIVDTHRCYGHCSTATIFAMSEQRPAFVLWVLSMLWAAFCLYRRPKIALAGMPQYGGLSFSEKEGRFFDANGEHVKLTPMQQQLMEMFFRSETHLLSKAEICDALWPKKPDASDTLYTLIRRLKPIIEAHSDLKIEADRGKAYELTTK